MIISIFASEKTLKRNLKMENQIILFSNIKGGVGKTTLCALFAEFLAENGYPVMALDADIQASLFRHRNRDMEAFPEEQLPWNVDVLNTSDGNQLQQTMDKLKQIPGIVLIDCPGNLNDRNLEYIYKCANAAIIPTSFDADTIDATGLFVKAFRTVSRAELVFIPNRISSSERRSDELRQRTQTIDFLQLVGKVVPFVRQAVAVKRYNTILPLEKAQLDAVENPFNKIIDALNWKEK